MWASSKQGTRGRGGREPTFLPGRCTWAVLMEGEVEKLPKEGFSLTEGQAGGGSSR